MIPLAGLDAVGVVMPAGVINDRAIFRTARFQFPAHRLAQVQRNPDPGLVVVRQRSA